ELGFWQGIVRRQTELQDRIVVVVIFNAGDSRLQVYDQVIGPSGKGGTHKEVGAVEITCFGFHVIVGKTDSRGPVHIKGAGLEATHAQLEDSFVSVTNQATVDDQLAILQAETNTTTGVECAGLKIYRHFAVIGGLAPFLEEAPGRAQFSGRGWGLGMSQRTDAGEGGAQSDCVF